jgi:hypothetical protein
MPNPNTQQALSKAVLGITSLFFLYIIFQSISIVNRRHIRTEDGIYINSTSASPYIKKLAHTLSKNCQTDSCKVQNILNYVTNIPYKINNFQAHSPQQTIQENYGDCDDKSNLLISLLHELQIESYFVLVPKHIFIIVSLPNVHLNHLKKGLYINEKKYYILESTAKNSTIGFPLHYTLNEIKAIIEPFSNKKIDISNLKWKL